MGEKVWIVEEFSALFRANHLNTFQDFMEIQGKLLRELPDRTNLKFQLTCEGIRITFFMKKHRAIGQGRWFWDVVWGGGGKSPGRREGERILAFQRLGIPTMSCAAWGEERGKGPASFLITREVEGVPLDDAIQARWEHMSPAERRKIILNLSEVVATLHSSNFFHRDLYLCHFILQEGGRLALLDLQRVGWARQVRTRWFVKDIAALNSSSPEVVVSRTDKLRFFKAYRGRGKLDAEDRSFLRRVIKKTRKILRHIPREQKKQLNRPF